ncbi:hypothetical protein CYMTET_56382 [Cymbomonas tetramitiformis]|uniref:Uncharacterized protein n=1 Tax=Cymbomonas tetramitiformis TaxID=36881 RepID=A0AAE0BBE1_9CHLO|nr:hypothetical protein CYMTET_56382 [Cymbomonas tetramitiformis]
MESDCLAWLRLAAVQGLQLPRGRSSAVSHIAQELLTRHRVVRVLIEKNLFQEASEIVEELDEDPPTEHAVGALLKRPCEHEGCSNSVVGTSVVALCGIHGGGYRKVKRTGRPEENGAAGRAGEKVANSSRAKPLIQATKDMRVIDVGRMSYASLMKAAELTAQPLGGLMGWKSQHSVPESTLSLPNETHGVMVGVGYGSLEAWFSAKAGSAKPRAPKPYGAGSANNDKHATASAVVEPEIECTAEEALLWLRQVARAGMPLLPDATLGAEMTTNEPPAEEPPREGEALKESVDIATIAEHGERFISSYARAEAERLFPKDVRGTKRSRQEMPTARMNGQTPTVMPLNAPEEVEVICGDVSATFNTQSQRFHLDGMQLSGAALERLGGKQSMRKWKISVRVKDTGEMLGRWLTARGIPC